MVAKSDHKLSWKDIAMAFGALLMTVLSYYIYDLKDQNAKQWREISALKESVACIKGKLGMPER